MKKIHKCLLFALSVATISNIGVTSVLASTSSESELSNIKVVDSNYVNTITPTYNPDEIDWENIDEINVIYKNGMIEDQFLKDAQLKGIKVVFESDAFMINARFTYFSSVSWITRNGVRSLSVNPYKPFSIDRQNSWYELARYFQYHPLYTEISNPTKFTSLQNQYYCHVDFAKGFKTPWNIEPATPDKGYAGFANFKDKCN